MWFSGRSGNHLVMDFMIIFRDSVRVGQFAKENRSDSFSRDSGTTFIAVNHGMPVLSSSFWNDHANGQHNTVVKAKNIAATSWLCVLLDNTTMANVYIHLEQSHNHSGLQTRSQERVTDWTRSQLRPLQLAMDSCLSLAKIRRERPKLNRQQHTIGWL